MALQVSWKAIASGTPDGGAGDELILPVLVTGEEGEVTVSGGRRVGRVDGLVDTVLAVVGEGLVVT